MQRWLTRPFVPFPEELKQEEKDYYRKYQFQARTEEHADNMSDLQATRVYSGWGSKHLVSEIIWKMHEQTDKARNLAQHIYSNVEGGNKTQYELLDTRLNVFNLVMNNALNAVSYQAQIDRVKELDIKPDFHNVISAESGWDRQLMLQTARSEIDNTARLLEILKTNTYPLLDLAPTGDEEDIRRLCPDLVGGGEYSSFENVSDSLLDQEMIVRSAQIHALMPMMQFSVAPWRILDEEHHAAVLKAVETRTRFTGTIVRLSHEAAKTNQPVVRYLECSYPHQGYTGIKDEFLLGDSVLVAPVVQKNMYMRTVVLPEGNWQYIDGKEYEGPCEVEIEAPIDVLPYFVKK